MTIEAEINPGVCGLGATVNAVSADGMNVDVHIESDCPKVRAMATELASLNAFDQVLRMSYTETAPALLAAKHGLHATCMVPSAVLKAIEAAAGLALPAPCGVKLARVEPGE